MKIHFSLPKDEGFFNSYATLTPTLYRLGFLAQLVSAMTEIGILYSLVYTTLIDAFPKFAHPAALVGAVIGTAFLEVGLRQFLPYSFRAILFKRFGGLHLVMSLFILLVSAGLLFSSGLLSFKGSKDLVAAVAPAPDQLGTGAVDSLYQERGRAINHRFDAQQRALREKYRALVGVQQQQFKKYEEREKRTGLSYITRKTRIKGKIAELQAEEAEKLADLESGRAQSLAAAEGRHLQGLQKVASRNDSEREKSERAISRYGGGLAWFTIVCLFVLVLSIALDEVHKKGSGIETKALPDQYHFSQRIGKELVIMLSEKWNYFTRSWIRRQADRTPPPLQPAPLPVLYEMADTNSRRIKIRTPSAPDLGESFYQLSAYAGNGYEKLFEPEVDTSAQPVPVRTGCAGAFIAHLPETIRKSIILLTQCII